MPQPAGVEEQKAAGHSRRAGQVRSAEAGMPEEKSAAEGTECPG